MNSKNAWALSISAAIVVAFSISLVSAWTGPTQAPPNGNVAAPINVGSVFQDKAGAAWFDGGLGIDDGGALCIGASCITAWPGSAGWLQEISAPYFNATSNATSTFFGGINLTSGCLAINGICIGGSVLGGSGTTNRVPKFTAATTLGNSLIFDNGTNVGIGNTAPSQKLDVTGYVKGTGMCIGASCITAWPSGGGAPTALCDSYQNLSYGSDGTICITLATGKICHYDAAETGGAWDCSTPSAWGLGSASPTNIQCDSYQNLSYGSMGSICSNTATGKRCHYDAAETGGAWVCTTPSGWNP